MGRVKDAGWAGLGQDGSQSPFLKLFFPSRQAAVLEHGGWGGVLWGHEDIITKVAPTGNFLSPR